MKQKIEDLSEQDYKEFFEWLLEKKVISYNIYSKMQKLLIKKMDKIILEEKS